MPRCVCTESEMLLYAGANCKLGMHTVWGNHSINGCVSLSWGSDSIQKDEADSPVPRENAWQNKMDT